LHPAKTFLNYGIKIAISPDDPQYFGILDLSHDFYAMALACEFDLKDLKLCVINSVEYSLMEK